jgi:hypothetical protein
MLGYPSTLKQQGVKMEIVTTALFCVLLLSGGLWLGMSAFLRVEGENEISPLVIKYTWKFMVSSATGLALTFVLKDPILIASLTCNILLLLFVWSLVYWHYKSCPPLAWLHAHWDMD